MATVLAYALMIPVMLIALGLDFKNKLAELDSRFAAWAYRPEQRKAWRLFSRAGDGWLYTGYWLLLRWRGESGNKLASAMLCAWGLGSAMKWAFRRRRQNQGSSRYRKWGASWSFPSQHAACAVAFACALWPNPTGVAFALLVCASRVLIGAHYLSDVLAGVAVGLLAWRLA